MLDTIDPIDTRDLSRFTVHACRELGQSHDVVDLGSGVDISCQKAAELILERVKKRGRYPLGHDVSKSRVVNVPMRDGEKPGVQLKADMSYWDSVGMAPEYSFEDTIDATITCIARRPKHELVNALRYYGKEV